MKKVRLPLILSALLVFIFSETNARTVSPWDLPLTKHGQPAIKAPLRARTGHQLTNSNSSKALDDATWLLTNTGNGRDYEIWFYPVGGDDYYYIDVPPNRYDVPFTIPAGTYDIAIAPDDDYHHYIQIGCNITWGGFGPHNFYGVGTPNGQSCNQIWYE